MAAINLSNLRRLVPQLVDDDFNPRVVSEDDFLYKDIKLDLEIGNIVGNFPVDRGVGTADLADIRNVEDLRQSLYNIFNTMPGQKLLNPYLGLNLSRYLFEPITPQTADRIARAILMGLGEQEPRISIAGISVMGDVDAGIYDVEFSMTYRDKQIEEVVFKGTLSRENFNITL